FRQLEVAEKGVGHPRVVVLTGVDEDALVTAGGEGCQDRRDLHEVGSRPGDDERAQSGHPATSVAGRWKAWNSQVSTVRWSSGRRPAATASCWTSSTVKSWT